MKKRKKYESQKEKRRFCPDHFECDMNDKVCSVHGWVSISDCLWPENHLTK